MTRIHPVTTPTPELMTPKRAPTPEAETPQQQAPADSVQIRADAAEAALAHLAGPPADTEVVITRDRWEDLPQPASASSARDLAAQIRAMMLKRPGA